MEKITLTSTDKKYLIERCGYIDKDIEQIQRTSFLFWYSPTRKADYPINSATAIRLVGRNSFVSGLARATFHCISCRTNKSQKRVVYIERAE